MKQQTYVQVTGLIFAVIALLHGLRLALRWEATIAGWIVPMWVSWVALVVPGYLAFSAFRLRSRSE